MVEAARVGSIFSIFSQHWTEHDFRGRAHPARTVSHAVRVLLVWAVLATALLFVGIRVVAGATPAWPVLLLFMLLVVRILQTV